MLSWFNPSLSAFLWHANVTERCNVNVTTETCGLWFSAFLISFFFLLCISFSHPQSYKPFDSLSGSDKPLGLQQTQCFQVTTAATTWLLYSITSSSVLKPSLTTLSSSLFVLHIPPLSQQCLHGICAVAPLLWRKTPSQSPAMPLNVSLEKGYGKAGRAYFQTK